MTNKLQEYFPTIRSRREILTEIEGHPTLKTIFCSWSEEQQEEFLDFCTGVRGVKILYDFMSKEILNPETTPERVEELLSLLLEQEVKIVEVLPNDSTRIADESSLVIKDMVVELADHSLVNLEIQKIGYKFPGERSACYSSDLLLRQYKRVRSRQKKKFSYKDIKDVYTIVLFEQSPKEFHEFPELYLHAFQQQSDTGLELHLLQKYLFISLDNYRRIQHNKGIKIESRLEAWLAFLCMDEPEAVTEIIERYPDFKEMYEQVYSICKNIEEVMSMFSEELRELDRNTVELMIDEMQEELNQARKEKREAEKEKQEAVKEKQDAIKEKQDAVKEKQEAMKEAMKEVQKAEERIQRLKKEREQIEVQLEEKYQQALERIKELEKRL